MRSVPISDPGDLLLRMPGHDAMCWLRGGDGLVGWGEVARLHVKGPDRFKEAAAWWQELSDGFDVADLVAVPGSGPVAFASFTFEDGPDTSVVVVPKVVIGKRGGASWVTTYDDADPLTMTAPVQSVGEVRYSDGQVTPAAYQQSVADAVTAIESGRLEKVVLVRDLIASLEHAVDARALLRPLVERYPSCWTFAVDGLIGSTPELLVRRTGDHIVSRVLAGTIDRAVDAVVDARRSAELLASAKDRFEHQLAVESVVAVLTACCSDLVVPRTPEIVRLANVQHLQTDITGRLANGESVLDLAAVLHPTAAVCGTPTEQARLLIRDIEGLDRRRFAGPVGWMDARGDGAFGIALRCAEVDRHDPRTVRMLAGAGIVDGSKPAEELAESEAKLLAVRGALERA